MPRRNGNAQPQRGSSSKKRRNTPANIKSERSRQPYHLTREQMADRAERRAQRKRYDAQQQRMEVPKGGERNG